MQLKNQYIAVIAEGKYLNCRLYFSHNNFIERTDDNFKNQTDENHQNGQSIHNKYIL